MAGLTGGRREVLWLRRVTGVGRGVVLILVAPDAGGGERGVIAGGVAVAAVCRRHHMRSRQREGSVVVIEG